MQVKNYTPMEIEQFFKNDDISILLKLPENYFDANKAKTYIKRFSHLTLPIYAFCEKEVQSNPMVIDAAIPGLAKARRLDLLPESVREDRKTIVKAITASSEAYFSLPEKFKEDIGLHMELLDNVENFLELPISNKILSNINFLHKCIKGVHPSRIQGQIINSNIPNEIKKELLAVTRKFNYEGNISLEAIKENILTCLLRLEEKN